MDWTPADLQRLQQTEMEMLALLDDICAAHDIRYYLAAGSCLGAMRHRGMIPWDDDIDVYLHREDYDRLSALLPQALPPGYFFQSAATDPAFMYPFAKIRKNNTAFVQEALRDIPMHHGIYIDLFPVDGAPRQPLLRFWQSVRLLFLKRIAIGHILPRRAERALYALLYRFLPRPRWQRLYERCCRRYDSRQTGLCLCAASEYAYRRELLPRAVYGRGRRVPFGPLSLPVPDDADTYLTVMYGDWRTPPPEHARGSQHAPWHLSFDREYHP